MAKVRRRGGIKRRGPNSWLVSLFIGLGVDGKRKDFTRTVRGTRKDAEQSLNKIIRELDQGMLVDNPSMTLNEYFDKWLESSSRMRNSQRTADGHKSNYDRYFRNTIGVKKLEKLQPFEIQKVYAALVERGLSPQTVKHAHAVIRCALNQAVKWNLLARNPALLTETPPVHRKERRVLNAEETKLFINKCDKTTNGLIFEFAVLTGMRPEEFLAVQKSDLDFRARAYRLTGHLCNTREVGVLTSQRRIGAAGPSLYRPR